MTPPVLLTVPRSIGEIQAWLVDWIAREAGLAADAIDIEEQLVNYGLSSRQAVVLAGELEDWLGKPLPASLVWDYPTIARMAGHLGSIQ